MIRGSNVDLRKVDQSIHTHIHNRFDVEIVDSLSGEIRQKAVGFNVIGTQLWSRLKSGSYFSYIHYGSGEGTPSSADTTLFSFEGSASASNLSIDFNREECWISAKKSIQLSESVSVGVTLTEVGIGYGQESSKLCTHAMLRDMNGNPISLKKTDTDIVNIYATVFVHWPYEYTQTDSPVQFIPTIDTTDTWASYQFLYWLLGIGTFPREIIAVPSPDRCSRSIQYNAGPVVYGSKATAIFDPVAKALTLAFPRFPADKANVESGSHGMMIYSYAANGMYGGNTVNPIIYLPVSEYWYKGTQITGESIGTGDGMTLDFATIFDLPEAASVYVDGELVADAVVDSVPVRHSLMQRYFNYIEVVDGKIYSAAQWRATNLNGDSARNDIYGGVYENPFHKYGIASITPGKQTISVSDDAIIWETFTMTNTEVPAEYQHKKYWKLPNTKFTGMSAATLTGNNIHFATPPADGAVITADYFSPTIAKDENHVFDLTITIQLGEYTDAQ